MASAVEQAGDLPLERYSVNARDAVFFGGPWKAADGVAARRAKGAVIGDDPWYATPNWLQLVIRNGNTLAGPCLTLVPVRG